jgi:hypothetical protein
LTFVLVLDSHSRFRWMTLVRDRDSRLPSRFPAELRRNLGSDGSWALGSDRTVHGDWDRIGWF